MGNELKELLNKVASEHPTNSNEVRSYIEDIEEHYASASQSGCSWIYKVGVLACLDGSKLDWAYLYIGYQRSVRESPIYLGTIEFPEGENDDCARVLKRILRSIQAVGTVFDDN